MSYYFNKVISTKNFDEAIEQVTAALKVEGFGVLTDINIQKAFKEKIDVDFKKYRILGACNPGYAHKALLAEDKIGVFLPCNVIVEEHDNGDIEVSTVDPIASMSSIENENLGEFAIEVQGKMKAVIAALK
ncbi:MAG: DUF302 domain-containing protein [Flavobacteriaceae bacterium]|nr:DUF302 domain-containing protein [Flavobacteriaceae bacterium]